jgi:hypothetical protein
MVKKAVSREEEPYPPISAGGSRYVANFDACMMGRPNAMNMYVPMRRVIGAKVIRKDVMARFVCCPPCQN